MTSRAAVCLMIAFGLATFGVGCGDDGGGATADSGTTADTGGGGDTGGGADTTGPPFYEGKTITLAVGFSPGGGFDKYARLTAAHLGNFIPGNPTVEVENRSGNGSVDAANWAYTDAPKDGTVMISFHHDATLQQALGVDGLNFESSEFGWIGAPVRGWGTCAVMGFTGYSTWGEVVAADPGPNLGSTNVGSQTNSLPLALNEFLGSNFQIQVGFEGTAEIMAAAEAGEVDGACFGWESMSVTAANLLEGTGDGQLIPVITHANAPGLDGLPRILDEVSAENEAPMRAFLAPGDYARAVAFPPGVPVERLTELRAAYTAMMGDADFLAAAETEGLQISHSPGDQVQELVDAVTNLSDADKARLSFLLQ